MVTYTLLSVSSLNRLVGRMRILEIFLQFKKCALILSFERILNEGFNTLQHHYDNACMIERSGVVNHLYLYTRTSCTLLFHSLACDEISGQCCGV